MRVISGKARGLKLISPDGLHTRPTLDRVKEAVFSFLLPFLCDSSVLDLFAGSGALGIEALSRGASNCVFVDNNADSIKCIKQNLSSCKFADNSEVKYSSATEYLTSTKEKFDIIFLDPPYMEGLYNETLSLICQNNILTEDGMIIVESDNEIGFCNDVDDLVVFKEKRYGRVGITVLVKR